MPQKKKLPPVIEEDHEEEKPAPYAPAPILLAPTSLRIVTDAEIGLIDDPMAQHQAEVFIRHAIAFHRKQSEKGKTND